MLYLRVYSTVGAAVMIHRMHGSMNGPSGRRDGCDVNAGKTAELAQPRHGCLRATAAVRRSARLMPDVL